MQHRNVTNVCSFSFDAVMSLKVTVRRNSELCDFLYDLFVTQRMRAQCQIVRSQNLCCSCYITLFFIEGYSQLRAIVGAVGPTSLID